MNRQQEYWDLIRELDHTPAALDGTALRAKARAKRRRTGKRWGISLGGAAGVCAAFVLAVNTLPTFALACANVPVLRELAAAVAFSPSLSAAVEHDYVQYIGQSQSFDGLTLTLEYVIADQQQMVVFYRVDGGAYPYYSVACDLKGENGVPLEGYAVTSGDSQEELKQFQIHFKEMEEPPRKLTLDVELLGTDAEGEDHPLDHIFTFQIALAARYWGIPYLVTGSPNPSHPDLSSVVIEERDPDLAMDALGTRTTLPGVKGYYPAFDVTPPKLCDGVVTEKGIFAPVDLKRYFTV